MISISSSLIIILLSLCTFHVIIPALAADTTSTSTTTSNSTLILLSCGTSGTTQDENDRVWIGDINSKYISQITSETWTIPYRNPSVPNVPFTAGRIFTVNYTYTFPLSPGRYFLRLYFYPTNYSSHLASDSYFSVTAGPYTLLSNFSALITMNALNCAFLMREFSINVTSTALNLTFSPSSKHPNAYAFINGIEIVSSPDIFSLSNAYLVNGGRAPTEFSYDPGMAFQTMYRLNAGGKSLNPSEDSGGLYRSWENDSGYILGAAFGVTYQNDKNVTIEYPKAVPQYIAPALVYETARSMGPSARINLNYNLTWILTVDAGFFYLLRFHFCEIQYPINSPNRRVFNIYVNNQTAQTEFDVIGLSGGIGIPVYTDFVVTTIGSGQTDIWVALHPSIVTKPMFYDAILNGLEVFKMSMAENNLAGLNPVLIAKNTSDPIQASDKMHHGLKGNAAAIIGGTVAGSVLIVSLISCACLFVRDKKKQRESEEERISDKATMSVSTEITITNNSTTTDSYNSFSSAYVGTFHDAR